jgi:hypothetical protein
MSVGLAPRPSNEELRVKAVVKTGLVDAPNPELFQVYCDLAKDISGFDYATFSLFDGEMQCLMANAGENDKTGVGLKKPGDKGVRTEFNVCSYVLLDSEPLLMPDVSKDPVWKDHPKAKSSGYAGFPVINRDNYALGTLCMFHSSTLALDNHQISLLKKICDNIAHLLDIQTQQKEMTSQKILEALIQFRRVNNSFTIEDFENFMSISSDLKIDMDSAKNLIDNSLCCFDDRGSVIVSSKGTELQRAMKIEAKEMKKIKMTGDDASKLIDQMFSELE